MKRNLFARITLIAAFLSSTACMTEADKLVYADAFESSASTTNVAAEAVEPEDKTGDVAANAASSEDKELPQKADAKQVDQDRKEKDTEPAVTH